MEEAEIDYRKYLDPKVLAGINGLELRARLIIEGFYSGMHHSPHHGVSVEFADHRSYTQGDDLRHVDWKVFGKTDKYYIKEYEQETNLDVMLAIDASASMDFTSAGGSMSKYEYATALAAAIGYLALQQHDSVGVTLFDESLSAFIKPSNRADQWKEILRELAGRTGPAKTSLLGVLQELTERLPHPMLIILISDLFDDPADVLRGFRYLQHNGHELIVWNLWDPAELDLPFRGPIRFEGLEAEGHLLTDPRSLRDRYLQEVERFQQRLRTGCGRMEVDYQLFSTDTQLDTVLRAHLGARSARLRRRSSRVMGGG